MPAILPVAVAPVIRREAAAPAQLLVILLVAVARENPHVEAVQLIPRVAVAQVILHAVEAPAEAAPRQPPEFLAHLAVVARAAVLAGPPESPTS